MTQEEVMSSLQTAGLVAGVVHDSQTIHFDPQLKHRQHFQQLNHPVIGPHNYAAQAFKLSKVQGRPSRPGPCLGEHNEYVYTKILGIPDEEFVELLGDGVFD